MDKEKKPSNKETERREKQAKQGMKEERHDKRRAK
jgi:hypothetical protein